MNKIQELINNARAILEDVRILIDQGDTMQREDDLKDIKNVIDALKWTFKVIPRWEQQYKQIIDLCLFDWDN